MHGQRIGYVRVSSFDQNPERQPARGALDRWRGRLMGAGSRGKQLLGVLLLLVGGLILSGADRRIEAFALDHLPDWMTRLSTAF